jgi:hypothetical protein
MQRITITFWLTDNGEKLTATIILDCNELARNPTISMGVLTMQSIDS